MQRLDKYSKHPTEQRANGHRRYKDASGHLAAIRNDYEKGTDDRSNGQRNNYTPPILAATRVSDRMLKGTVYLLAKLVIVMRAFAFEKKDFHAFSHINS